METIDTNTERLKYWNSIGQQTWSTFDIIAPGIHLYRDVLTEDLNIIATLENYLNENKGTAKWEEAQVGYQQRMPDYRDCYDFKFKTGPHLVDSLNQQEVAIREMYELTKFKQLQAVKHYCGAYNIGEMRYWEATNFVKYGPKQHFAEHADHGYSYNCTVSLVGYPNDNYEGGELEFRLWNLKIKPRTGDLVIFPSNFMYPHLSLPVIEGTKYSLVTMLDYSDKFHKQEFYQETGS